MTKEEFAVLVSVMMKAQQNAKDYILSGNSISFDEVERLEIEKDKHEAAVIEEIYETLYPYCKRYQNE